MKIKLNKQKIPFKNKATFNHKIKEEEDENNDVRDEYKDLIKTLQKNKNSRTRKDQTRINSYLCKNINYFKNYSKLIEEEALEKITGIVNYKHFPSEYKIYTCGDDVDKLYILLKGSIKILKPVTITKSMSLRDYVEYLAKIRDEEKNEVKFKRIQDYNKKVNILKLISIDYDYTQIPPAKEDNYIIEEEKEINILSEGNAFGEITLAKDEKRNETIITNEECDIINLDRNEYIKLRTIEEQKLNNKLIDFRIDFPLFKFWNNQKLIGLKKALIEEKYEKGDIIYKQNDKPEYIYLIEQGTIEAFNHTKFYIYEDFIEYIHDSTNSLAKDMDNYSLWQEKKISEKIEKAYNELEYLKFTLKREKFEDDEELNEGKAKQEIDENKEQLVNQMEKINDNMKNYSYKANIQIYSAPQIFGYLEAIELKRRFCTIRCISNKAIISKIPIMDFLLLIPTDKKSIFQLQTMLFEEKKTLMEQVKNNALAKLTFIRMNSLKKKIINLYNSNKNKKGNNNQFRFSKALKFRNDTNFAFNSNRSISKSLIKSSENNNNNISNIKDSSKIKKSEILNLKKRLENEKFGDTMIDKFKKTMIRLNKNEFDVIKKLYPKKVKNSFLNSNFAYTNRNFHDNNYLKFLESNKNWLSNTKKLPFSMSMGDLTAKNYSINTKLNFFNRKKHDNNKKSSLRDNFLLPSINSS